MNSVKNLFKSRAGSTIIVALSADVYTQARHRLEAFTFKTAPQHKLRTEVGWADLKSPDISTGKVPVSHQCRDSGPHSPCGYRGNETANVISRSRDGVENMVGGGGSNLQCDIARPWPRAHANKLLLR